MLRQAVRSAVGLAAALVLGATGASAYADSAPRGAVEAASTVAPLGCAGSPSGCT
ncbi:hypothetical protein [Streptomyces sp. NPDC047071]|uniref:hypothetical protein n=1 Tax=Streptomyces sp. NPDC047071 TaxID=3154808 RepID=UPI003451F9C5